TAEARPGERRRSGRGAAPARATDEGGARCAERHPTPADHARSGDAGPTAYSAAGAVPGGLTHHPRHPTVFHGLRHSAGAGRALMERLLRDAERRGEIALHIVRGIVWLILATMGLSMLAASFQSAMFAVFF